MYSAAWRLTVPYYTSITYFIDVRCKNRQSEHNIENTCTNVTKIICISLFSKQNFRFQLDIFLLHDAKRLVCAIHEGIFYVIHVVYAAVRQHEKCRVRLSSRVRSAQRNCGSRGLRREKTGATNYK